MAAFGTAAARAEERLWADSRPCGAAFAVLTVGPVVAASAGAQRWLREDGVLAVAAAATWTMLGGASRASFSPSRLSSSGGITTRRAAVIGQGLEFVARLAGRRG